MVADTRVICCLLSSRGGEPRDRGLPALFAGLRGLPPAELQSAQPHAADFSKTLTLLLCGEANRRGAPSGARAAQGGLAGS